MPMFATMYIMPAGYLDSIVLSSVLNSLTLLSCLVLLTHSMEAVIIVVFTLILVETLCQVQYS